MGCECVRSKISLNFSDQGQSVALHSQNFFLEKKEKTMKKETWKTIIQVVISILTAALTAMGTTSCMGHGPF